MNENGANLSDEQVTDIVKKKRKRPDRTEALTPQYQPGHRFNGRSHVVLNAIHKVLIDSLFDCVCIVHIDRAKAGYMD